MNTLKLKTPLIAAALLTVTAGLVLAYPHTPYASPVAVATTANPVPPPAATQASRPRIEAVFVLDTTGSMSGLIQAAKDNIWSIASSMAQAQPTPELKIGLVAFRDRGDEYVTRTVELSGDLDSVYAQLMDFQAGGGGDTPEAVNQALNDAVEKIAWSQGDHAYRTIFLVGDAPPQSYQDEPGYPQVIARAKARGIIINAIQAGGDTSTRHSWQEIAGLAGGAFFEVGQAGSAVAVATPFDDAIASLSRELDDSRMFFGDADTKRDMARKQAAAEKVHAAAPAAAQAKRALFNSSAAGADNLLGENELVDAVSSGRVALADLPSESLPAALAPLPPAEQAAKIEETASRRREIQSELKSLAAQRQAHIDTELAKETDSRDSLDYRLFETVKAQSKDKGLRYDDAKPVH